MHAYIIQKEGFLAVADTNLSFAHTSRAMWELCVWVCWWVGGGCGCVFLTFGKARVRGVPTRTHQWQKRPTKVSKETYYSVKRDLLQTWRTHTHARTHTHIHTHTYTHIHTHIHTYTHTQGVRVNLTPHAHGGARRRSLVVGWKGLGGGVKGCRHLVVCRLGSRAKGLGFREFVHNGVLRISL